MIYVIHGLIYTVVTIIAILLMSGLILIVFSAFTAPLEEPDEMSIFVNEIVQEYELEDE